MKLGCGLLLALAATGIAQDLPPESQQESEYNGPAILSRAGTFPGGGLGAPIRLRPYTTVEAVYDTGLGVMPNQQANGPYISASGIETGFGVIGSRAWRHSWLDLNCRGSFRRYSQNTYLNGVDGSLLMDFQHRLTRRITFRMSEEAATYANSYGVALGAFQPYNPDYSALTANDLYFGRTHALMSTAQMVYQKTLRLSFSAEGTGFVIRRQSAGRIGANGYSASGKIAYRVSRHRTIGLIYTFSRFDFVRMFGNSVFQSLAADYSARIGRFWQVSLLAGLYRVDFLHQRQVQLDPEIVAILGTTTGTEVHRRLGYSPQYSARLTREFRRSALSLNYARAIVPGNDVLLTSGSKTAGLDYTYRGIRNLGLDAYVGYTAMTSLAQTSGEYRNYTAGAAASRRLGRSLSLIARMEGRRWNLDRMSLQRTFYRVSAGFAFSQGDYPLAPW